MSGKFNTIRAFAIAMLSLVVSGASAQETLVKGKISDANDGSGLPGASITVKGAEIAMGTVTDVNGDYSLYVNDGTETLVISFVGFVSQEININGRSVINATLTEDVEQLEELVVTALGITRKKESLGYAVSDVGGDELAEVRSTNAVNALSGKVAGVDIGQSNTGASGSSKVVIRGNSKITGTNQPLYVIDGVPIDNSNQGEAGQYGGQDLGDGLTSINQDDIESISVLKGPAASALYGTRASNGVILITTKSWNKEATDFSVEFNSNVTIDQVYQQFDDVQQVYGQGIGSPPKDIGDATGMWSWGDKMDPDLTFVTFDGTPRDYGRKDDNILGFFRTGVRAQNTISLSGGNNEANFRFSASDLRMNDIVPNSGLTTNTVSLRGTMKMWEKLTLDSKFSYSNEKVENRPYLGYSGANTALSIMRLPSNFDQSWLENSRVDENGDYVYWNSSTRIINPYFALNNMENESTRNRIIGYTSLNYEINDWLNFAIKSGIDTYNTNYYNYSPITTPLALEGQMSSINGKVTEINSDFLLTGDKQLNEDIELSASVGGNIMSRNSFTNTMVGTGEVARGLVSINNYNEYTVTYTNPKKQINSLYSFVNLTYKGYLFLDVTGRNDWSSTLPEANNSYFYPSFSSAFVFTEAIPGVKSKLVSYGKLRASYAEVGGDTDPYNLLRTFSSYPYTLDGVSLTSEGTTVLPNANLKPSRTSGVEVGIDMKLLNWRVGLDINYYNQRTIDEIISLPISAASNYEFAFVNAGEISNKGLEAMINIVPVKNDDWRWDLTLIWARNRNQIVKLSENAKVQEIARADWVGSFIQAREGGSYGDIIGYDFLRTEDGRPILDDAGMPQPTTEQVVIGNGQQKWTGGITNTVRYKGFSFRALIEVKYGADLLSMTNMQLHQYGQHENTLEGREGWSASESERLDAGVLLADWTPTDGYLADGVVQVGVDGEGNPEYEENQNYVDPRLYWSNVVNDKIMTPFVYDATYVKLREVSLSYTFSDKILNKLNTFEAATFSIIARNLWLIHSNVPNIDPESSYSITNGQGYEYGALPQRRSFGFNLKLNF